MRLEGRIIHVADVDIVDGTPLLDLKPYVQNLILEKLREQDGFP